MALTLYCGNVVYLYLSVAFIQILKVGDVEAIIYSESLRQLSAAMLHVYTESVCA